MRQDSKLAKLLGKGDRPIPMQLEMPTHPGRKIGLRPLTEHETGFAHAAAIKHCRNMGYFSDSAEESAESLAQVHGTKEGREKTKHRSGLVGAMAVIATSELGYAIQCEELALALCNADPRDFHPLVADADELRDVLERPEVEWLAEKLEQWMRDRSPQRIHMTRAEIKEVVEAAKKGQRPTTQWNSCAYSTLLDFVTISVEALTTCGSGTSTSSTPAGLAPAT